MNVETQNTMTVVVAVLFTATIVRSAGAVGDMVAYDENGRLIRGTMTTKVVTRQRKRSKSYMWRKG